MVKEESIDSIKTLDDVNEIKLEGIFKTLNAFDHQIFLCARQTVYRLAVRGTTVIGMVLLAM